MGKIILKRKSAFADRMRAYQIYLDGKKVGKIQNGDDWEWICEDGSHTLQLRIDWCTSPTLTFESNGDFECQSNITGWKIPLAFFYIFQPIKWIRLTQLS